MNEGAAAALAAPRRVVSIDIFRGLTMCVMIFVNALSEVNGLPWWTYHARERSNVMTYVDMVFPFFLFIVGMSMPLSVEQRLKRNSSQLALWAHVLLRALGLVVLGLILANTDFCDTAHTGMNGSLWGLLALVSAGLYLNAYPATPRFRKLGPVLRGVGLVGVIALLAIFRRTTPHGHMAWLDFNYPEILGLIGLSYAGASLLYLPTRRWRWAPLFWFAISTAFCVLNTAQRLTYVDNLSQYVWVFYNGAMISLMMAGAATTTLYLRDGAKQPPKQAILLGCGLAVVALAAGAALMPLGISKLSETPTWALWSAGAAMLAFALLYWICDVKQWTKWAFFVRSAGANTLTTYLLPDLWSFAIGAIGFTWLDNRWNLGTPGVVKTLVFTAAILALSRLVTRLGVRLRF
jgi:predicted acyltransferase